MVTTAVVLAIATILARPRLLLARRHGALVPAASTVIRSTPINRALLRTVVLVDIKGQYFLR